MAKAANSNRYQALIESIFHDHFREDLREFEFARAEIKAHASRLKIALPENLGDVIYAMRFRTALPPTVLATQPEGREWVIELAGRSLYRFKLVTATRIVPRDDLVKVGIPDATPELIRAYALDDEQALLAIIRYNRLIDIFLGVTASSLQNHLRTTVKGIGQIEIDELYVGLDRHGCHFVIPVQAKVGKDQIGVVQTTQDISFANEKFPGMRCRAVSAQFMPDKSVALFELTIQDGNVRILQERHYRLLPADLLDRDLVIQYQD